ncbi:MAG: hypothetical protein E6R00_05555, partial [Gammaproteobacteria bacterium]
MSEQTLVLPAPPLPRRAAPSFEAWSLRCVFGVLAALALVFLVAPTLVILLTSFTATESLRFPPEGFSLRWYAALLDADQMQAAACIWSASSSAAYQRSEKPSGGKRSDSV